MARVFSWKLDDYKYGYIVPPRGDGKHISERITNDTVLSKMAQSVKTWDREKYEKMFNELNEEVFSTFHVSIPGTIDDYFGEEQLDNSYIILTGKDGANSNNCGLSEDDLKTIEKTVAKKINLAVSEIEQASNSLKTWVIDKTNSSILYSKAVTDEAIERMATINKSLADELESATESINIAASLFDFNGYGITREKLVKAIANSNSALTLASVADSKATDANEAINKITIELDSLQNEQTNLSQKIKLVNDTMLVNIGKVKQQIDVMEEEIADVKAMSYSQESSSSQEYSLAGKGGRSGNSYTPANSILTNVTQNVDGSYSSLVKIGNENYFVNVLQSGQTFTEENIKDGLTLSKNGFRYINNDAEMLVSDGVIKLLNKNSHGSIEINDEGVFINGKKIE